MDFLLKILVVQLNFFQVDYVTTTGNRPSLSPSASGTTWGGGSWYGIPNEWMGNYYGNLVVSTVNGVPVFSWPAGNLSALAGSPTTLYQVFLSGGNPTNSATWLHQTMTRTQQGMFLNWNTTPGATYQVQQTTNLRTWSNFGSARFAASTTDSINVGGSTVGYYRIVLQR